MNVDQRIIDMVSVEEGMRRPKSSSSLGVFVFEIGCFVFDLGVFVFEFWVLRFRDLGASFWSFGCFVLRSSFSSASFSKLPAF